MTKIRKDFSDFKYNKFNSSVNEWFNSIYNFDRNNLNTIYKSKIIYDILNSYFNIEPKNISKLKIQKKNLVHLKRIFVSIPEIKDSLSNCNINVYVFNKEIIILKKKITKLERIRFNNNLSNSSLDNSLTDFNVLSSKKTIGLNNKLFKNLNIFTSIKTYINIYSRSFYSKINKRILRSLSLKLYNKLKLNNYSKPIKSLSKFQLNYILLKNFSKSFSLKKISRIKLKSILYLHIYVTKKLNNAYNFIFYKKNYKNNLIKNKHIYAFMNNNLIKTREKLKIKYYILFFYKRYITRIYFNRLKFNYINLFNLNKIIYNIYDKPINISIVNLKNVHLDYSIFIEIIVRKLRKKTNSVLRILKRALTFPKIPTIDTVYTLNKNLFPEYYYKNNNNNDIEYNLNKFNEYLNIKDIKQVIFKSLKNIHIVGARLEGKGRLTRRFTASRSVYKKLYKGSLKNIYSSYKGFSAVMSKGLHGSNINYINLNSNRHVGSFGIKNWQNTM